MFPREKTFKGDLLAIDDRAEQWSPRINHDHLASNLRPKLDPDASNSLANEIDIFSDTFGD